MHDFVSGPSTKSQTFCDNTGHVHQRRVARRGSFHEFQPPYNEQKEILAQYEPWGGDITLPDNLPGSVASDERLIRLEYYLQYTPEPKTYPEAVANVRSLIATTNVPFGAPCERCLFYVLTHCARSDRLVSLQTAVESTQPGTCLPISTDKFATFEPNSASFPSITGGRRSLTLPTRFTSLIGISLPT